MEPRSATPALRRSWTRLCSCSPGESSTLFSGDAGPPTPDDVTITPEGFRLESKQAVLGFIALVEGERAAEAGDR